MNKTKKTHLFLNFILLLMVCAPAWTMRFESNIPDAGQEGQFTITNETERAIGKCLMYRINGSNAVSDDAIVQEYLRVLCDRISRAAPRCDFKLYYFPIQSNVLNAFAFFGGHVGVYTGLVLMVENESELAAVLAHETAHVTQRHLARMLVQQKKLTPLTISGNLCCYCHWCFRCTRCWNWFSHCRIRRTSATDDQLHTRT